MNEDLIALAYKISEKFCLELHQSKKHENMYMCWKNRGFFNIWSFLKDVPQEHHALIITILKSQKKHHIQVVKTCIKEMSDLNYQQRTAHQSFIDQNATMMYPAKYVFNCKNEYERITSLMK